MSSFSLTDPSTWNIPSLTNPFLELQRRIILRELRAQLETTYAINYAFNNAPSPTCPQLGVVTHSELGGLPSGFGRGLILGVRRDSNNHVIDSWHSPHTTPPLPLLLNANLPYIRGDLSYIAFTPPVPVTLPQQLGRKYEYGDCGETLPLAVVASISSQTGPAEISCLTAFTTKLCAIKSIADDGSVGWSVVLKPPCNNCKSLMGQIPGMVRVLAGSGRSNSVLWTVEKQGEYICNEEFRHAPLTYSRFSYSAVYAAESAGIYRMLELWTLRNQGLIWQTDIRVHLATMWHEFIVPYRDASKIFRLNAFGNIDPVMIPVNNTAIPICTVFCALGYILSTVLEPPRVHALRDSYFVPLMAILAKWCHTLCPWGRPNVVSIVGITSSVPYTVTRFLLGTSRPTSQIRDQPEVIHQGHSKMMRRCRNVLLQNVFGSLP